MRLTLKSAVITSAGVILLGTSLALSSAGVVSGANSTAGSRLVQPATTCSNSSGPCLTVSNTSKATGHHSAIEGSTVGKNATAIYGLGRGTSGIGVDGKSYGPTGFGVAGSNANGGVGVYGVGRGFSKSGTSTAVGVYGTAGAGNSGGAGVEGVTVSEAGVAVAADGGGRGGGGVYARANGIAGEFVSTSPYASAALIAEGSDGIDLFDAYGNGSASGPGYFTVDFSGDGTFSGSVSATSFNTDVRSRNGESLGASVALTPQATMEDTGTARLLNGEGAVRFDPAFASTINARRGYQVFLAPDGDTRGLYVSAKYEGGFIVRENERGRSSVHFDYRVVAHPYGASDARLPRLSIKPPTHAKLPKLPQMNNPQL